MSAKDTIHMFRKPTQQEHEDSGQRCHVCQAPGPLTKEHVPPEGAFNDCAALWERIVFGRDSVEGRRSKIRNGVWVKSLCEDCNNIRCNPYATEYVRLAKHLASTSPISGTSPNERLLTVPADTLFVAKEIATMILAIEPAYFSDTNGELREFVLERDRLMAPPFRIFAFEVDDTPKAGTVSAYSARVDTYAPGYGMQGGEISMFPFGFVYVWEIGEGYHPERMTDITHWFSEGDARRRKSATLRLFNRLMGIGAMQDCFDADRKGPRIDRPAGKWDLDR